MNNYERMVQLATDVFEANSDPFQLDVNEVVIEQLKQLHHATLSEHIEGDGPVVWILLFPTTTELMNEFITGKISETELLNLTPLHKKYEALYLCSALVLPEFRRKGLARKIAMEAINQIRKEHPIKTIFTWNFSNEGALLAEKLSNKTSLPLLKRKECFS